MYINYNTVGGIEYGTAASSVRDGNKVGKGEQIYLGRVVDKELGIFKSRERGLQPAGWKRRNCSRCIICGTRRRKCLNCASRAEKSYLSM